MTHHDSWRDRESWPLLAHGSTCQGLPQPKLGGRGECLLPSGPSCEAKPAKTESVYEKSHVKHHPMTITNRKTMPHSGKCLSCTSFALGSGNEVQNGRRISCNNQSGETAAKQESCISKRARSYSSVSFCEKYSKQIWRKIFLLCN